VHMLGEVRATRYLRKFYPWYVVRLELLAHDAKRLQASLQAAESLEEVRELLGVSLGPEPAALAVTSAG
jgi:hypothetical protein